MKLQVLGMGCPKCAKLFESVKKALEILERSDAELEKVEKLADIAAMGAMLTPALAVDGEVLFAGRVPSPEEIADLLKNR